MQSQYGSSEIQQFMVDGGYSPFFPISSSDMRSSSQPEKHQHHAHQLQQLQQHHHDQEQQQQQHHHQQQPVQRQHHHNQQPHIHHYNPQLQVQQAFPGPQLQMQPFQHFHAIPITQQLFQTSHQFHLFQQEQQRRMHQQQLHLGLDQDLGPRVNPGSPTPVIAAAVGGAGGSGAGGGLPPFLGSINFKLAVNESASGGGSRDELKDEADVLHGDVVSENRIHPWSTREEESAIKEPFWRPLDVTYINRDNERCNEDQMEPSNSGQQFKVSREGNNVEDGNNGANNYKLFSELEAIYKPGSSGDSGGGGGGSRLGAGGNTNQQTGSVSALASENPPTVAVELGPDRDLNTEAADQVSNASTGEDAAQANKSSGSSRKRRRKQQLSSIATFLESLVKTLMEHQEALHTKFLEVLERRDQERTNREEMWRQQEADKAGREAMARAEEQALASTREAAIISFLEKITGESLNLPTRAQFQSQLPLESPLQKEGTKDTDHSEAFTATTAGGSGGNASTDGNKRAGGRKRKYRH